MNNKSTDEWILTDFCLFIYLQFLSFRPSSVHPLLFVINAAGCSTSSTRQVTVYCYAHNISIVDYWLRTYYHCITIYLYVCNILIKHYARAGVLHVLNSNVIVEMFQIRYMGKPNIYVYVIKTINNNVTVKLCPVIALHFMAVAVNKRVNA